MALKPSGHPCPNCGEPFPAEFAQIGQPAKWTCHGCGASGELAGSLSFSQPAKPAPKPNRVHPHWSARGAIALDDAEEVVGQFVTFVEVPGLDTSTVWLGFDLASGDDLFFIGYVHLLPIEESR